MSWCPDLCEDCLNNKKDNWCEEYNAPCKDCYENCRRNGTILSGDDIESQDDFNVWNTFFG